MRSNTTQRNIWAQFSVSACAVLLPPIALGAVLYSMLPARDDSAERPAAGSVGADSQPVAKPFLTAGKPVPPADGRSSAFPANAREQPIDRKDVAQTSSPVPGRVTVVGPPASMSWTPSADVDRAQSDSVAAEPWPPAAAVPPPLLPRAPTLPVQAPPPAQTGVAQVPAAQMSAAQTSATRVPAADRPSAESPPSPAQTLHRRVRPSYLGNLAGRSGARADARSETRAVRHDIQPPQQQPFSLQNWLHQLGARPRNTGG